MIPSSSPIAFQTFNTSSGDDPVMSNGGISSSLSIGTSASIAEKSISSPSTSTSASTSVSSVPSSVSSTSTSPSGAISSPCSGCSYKDFFLGPFKDSLTNSLISSFMVEASIPFAFSLIASSIDFICNKASSTIELFLFKLICKLQCVIVYLQINIPT